VPLDRRARKSICRRFQKGRQKASCLCVACIAAAFIVAKSSNVMVLEVLTPKILKKKKI